MVNNKKNLYLAGSNFVFDIKEQQPTNAFQEEIGNESIVYLCVFTNYYF